MPATMRPRDIVIAAKEKSIVLTDTHVYKVRAADAKKAANAGHAVKAVKAVKAEKTSAQPATEKSPKEARGGRKGGAKSAFVKSMPLTMTGREVVIEAQKRGIKLSVAHVYNIRSTSKRLGASAAPVEAKGASVAATGAETTRRRPGRPRKVLASAPAVTASNPILGAEAALLKAIAAIGLDRARQLFQRVEAAFDSVR
ncbi:MAG: hypothetical protein EXR75_04030 [Myxococcales bacterium]|nr:hypothetical protein [Myxococcales bacterium]